jgi:AcrR family transcriptional regulator
MTDVAALPAPRDKMADGSVADRRSPRESIFAAATRLFSEHGYNGASMRDIAKAVGILPGSLYAHISSKEAVLVEIIEGGVDRFNASIGEIEASPTTPDAALREAIRAHLRIVAEDPERTQIVFHQWRFLESGNRARILQKRARYADFYVRTLRNGINDGVFNRNLDPKVAMLTVLGALNWAPEWFSPQGPESPTAVADKITESLMGGLLARA